MALNLDNSALKYRSAGPALAIHPSGLVAAWMMVRGVIVDAHDFKVFQSIVVLDSVAMVNVLGSFKSSTNVCRHDRTMFKDVLTVDTNCDVSIRAHKASHVLRRSSAVH